MTRSIFYIDTYYPQFLEAAGLNTVAEPNDSYDTLLSTAKDLGFGTGFAYINAFKERGWNTTIAIPNALRLQSAWRQSTGRRAPLPYAWNYPLHLARLPIARSMLHWLPQVHGVLLEQVAAAQPDVIVVQDLNLVPLAFARKLRKHTQLLVGEIASPLPPKQYFTGYDIILSALPSIVEQARQWGMRSEYVPLGFDARWAAAPDSRVRDIDAVFVGSFSRHQPQTIPMLQAVAREVPGLRIYGPASQELIAEAGLQRNYVGEAWGREMFEVLSRSKIVVNRHGTVSGDYAVNMRMFEATGSGAALVTEAKSNLAELFEPGVEVEPYDSYSDVGATVARLLNEPSRLNHMAEAGFRRTAETHSYSKRAETIEALFEELLQ